MTPGARAAASAAAACAASIVATRAADALPRAASEPWARTNHAGRDVTLLEGPAWLVGATAGTFVAELLAARAAAVADGGADPTSAKALVAGVPGLGSARVAQAGALVTLAAGALGALDDLAGSTSSKGLRGHLAALRRGELTTGAIKVGGLGITGLVGAAMADGRGRGAATTVVGAAVVAGAANAINLFDLRPGRALKVVLAAAGPLALHGSGPAAAALGASAGVIRDDLAGRSMLGDTGANAAGALIGVALLERTGLRGRIVALAVLTGLTLASERVSFTKVIESHELLRRMDGWGRGRS